MAKKKVKKPKKEKDTSEPQKVKVIERVVEKEVPQKRSGALGIIIIIVILVIIGYAIIQSGALDNFSSGSGVPYVDPCEREFRDCNHECGEGTLSGLCKEKCSYSFRKCKNG